MGYLASQSQNELSMAEKNWGLASQNEAQNELSMAEKNWGLAQSDLKSIFFLKKSKIDDGLQGVLTDFSSAKKTILTPNQQWIRNFSALKSIQFLSEKSAPIYRWNRACKYNTCRNSISTVLRFILFKRYVLMFDKNKSKRRWNRKALLRKVLFLMKLCKIAWIFFWSLLETF